MKTASVRPARLHNNVGIETRGIEEAPYFHSLERMESGKEFKAIKPIMANQLGLKHPGSLVPWVAST